MEVSPVCCFLYFLCLLSQNHCCDVDHVADHGRPDRLYLFLSKDYRLPSSLLLDWSSLSHVLKPVHYLDLLYHLDHPFVNQMMGYLSARLSLGQSLELAACPDRDLHLCPFLFLSKAPR